MRIGRDEAQVKHLVGFVEDEDLGAGNVGGAALEMVDQAAGRRDEHVETLRQRLDLRTMADAAEHDGDLDAHMPAVGLEAVGDLRRQLARRRKDQHARALRWARALVLQQTMQNRQREGGRLAGAGLGDAQ